MTYPQKLALKIGLISTLFTAIIIIVPELKGNSSRVGSTQYAEFLYQVEKCVNRPSDTPTVVMYHEYNGYGCYDEDDISNLGIAEAIERPKYWFTE